MCWHREHLFAADGSAPGQARRAVDFDLGEILHPHARPTIDDAELVVSELMTNTLAAHARQARLWIDIHRDRLRIAVDDDGAGAPAPREAEATDENGRGLAIIAAVSHAWGYEKTELGKQVWAELPLDPAFTAAIDCTV